MVTPSLWNPPLHLVSLDVSVLRVQWRRLPRHIQLGGRCWLDGHVLRWGGGYCEKIKMKNQARNNIKNRIDISETHFSISFFSSLFLETLQHHCLSACVWIGSCLAENRENHPHCTLPGSHSQRHGDLRKVNVSWNLNELNGTNSIDVCQKQLDKQNNPPAFREVR